MRKNYILTLLLALTIIKASAQPTVAAPTPPTRPASNVISTFSGAYTDLAGTDWYPNWGQATQYAQITVAGDAVKKYSNLNYQGVQFASAINASTMTNLHIDIWSSDCSKFDVYPIVPGQPEQAYTINVTPSSWNSVDIPLSSYTIPLSNIIQFKFVSNTPATGTTVYLDNIYFWTASLVPTITGFSVPSPKLVTDAAFTLTQPTSNSSGAFTYTSSNTNVATISGSVVTMVGVGTTTITANQAASGGYGAGSASTTLVVNYTAPTAGTTASGLAAANVISMFSDNYTNRTIDTWSASWDQADVADVVLGGNNAKLYTNLNYCGIEFTGANSINATTMNYFHVDIWTPNQSAIKVKLVDFGANNSYGGGDDANSIEYQLTPQPTQNGWKSYFIPLSSFTGLTTRANLSQMLFVGSGTTFYVDNVYFSTSSTMPVVFTNFNAIKNGNLVNINWSTSSEINNKGFGIERSIDGINFTQIQFVNANGNSTVNKNYTVIDNSPIKGMNYYRLVQVDNDGKQTYSSVVSVKFAGNDGLGITFYPNPVKSKLTVQLDNISNNATSLTLVNVEGKVVRSKMLNQQNSNTTISFDVANIIRGVYYLVIKDGQISKASKVIIE